MATPCSQVENIVRTETKVDALVVTVHEMKEDQRQFLNQLDTRIRSMEKAPAQEMSALKVAMLSVMSSSAVTVLMRLFR